MSKNFFDDAGNYAYTVSDNMAINSEGDLLMRMDDDFVINVDSGEMHMTSGWSIDDDDD